MEATAKMKNGEKCDLLSRLAAEKEFGLSEDEMKKLLRPSLYIGRCSEQVTAFLKKVRPMLKNIKKEKTEINL